MKRALALVVVVVLAGCAAPIAQEPSDPIGEVEGITHDQQLSLSATDRLNESEQQALARRAMARLEVIRGLNFEHSIDIEVLTRTEYRESDDRPTLGGGDSRWQNQVWEALFVVGETRDVNDVLAQASVAGVQGYYNPGSNTTTLIVDDDINTETLVHELVHALQHQQLGLSIGADTQDSGLAHRSVIEGEAELLTERYFDRCGVVWDCFRPGDAPGADGDSGDSDDTADIPLGLQLYILQPYTQGTAFIESIRERGDWSAVDRLHEAKPNSSEQVIHPARYPDDRPTDVRLPDRSSGDWRRVGHDPATDTLGEASVYAMLLDNGVITVDDPTRYDHVFSEGWAGGAFAVYRNQGGESGYVWKTEWDSQTDAEQFAGAYREVLDEHDATPRGDGIEVITDEPFADAFRVTQTGTTVRIVNAPFAGALSAVHPRQ